MKFGSPGFVAKLVIATSSLTLLLIAAMVAGVCLGSTQSSIQQIFFALVDPSQKETLLHTIVWQLRIPRVLLAATVGATLSLGGLVFQAILRNPLAEPYILGISGGSAIGAIAGILMGFSRFPGVTLAAFSGSLATLLLILMMTSGQSMMKASSLLLSGVMVNSFCSAVIMFLVSLTQDDRLHNIIFWLMGDLSRESSAGGSNGGCFGTRRFDRVPVRQHHEPLSHGAGYRKDHGCQYSGRDTDLTRGDLPHGQRHGGLLRTDRFCGSRHSPHPAADPGAGSSDSGAGLRAGRRRIHGVLRHTGTHPPGPGGDAGGRYYGHDRRTPFHSAAQTVQQMKTAIDIRNLSHSYGDRPVLTDVTFQVAVGEFFIIIGPNGSGKTTLLKTLAGVDTLQTGNVEILNRPLSRYTRKALAQTLSFVPQSMPLDFPFSVMQTVLMGRYPYLGMLGIEGEEDLSIARRAIDFAGVAHLADRKMDELSGGERQRAFIARALCQDPKLLLLDEPTAALDLAHQVRVMDLMEQLKREAGVSILMVSHDVNLAAMYADRLLLLKEGRIVAVGTPRQVMTYEILESVYGCPLLVDETSLDRCPRITLVPRRFLSEAGTSGKRLNTEKDEGQIDSGILGENNDP